MSLKLTHLFADADGDTHFTDIEVPAVEDFGAVGLAGLEIQTTTLRYIEYPAKSGEVIPGLHCTPRRQLDCLLQGGVEISTSTGTSRVFGPGEWVFFDDMDSKGHRTRDVGEDPRILMVIGVADEWKPVGPQ